MNPYSKIFFRESRYCFPKKIENISYDSLRKKFINLAIKKFFSYYWIFEISLSTNNAIKEILNDQQVSS